MFILDPFITIPILAGLILAWRKEKLAFKISIALLVSLSMYLLFCLYSREINLDKLTEFAKVKSLEVVKFSVYPRPLAPFFLDGHYRNKRGLL